MLMRPVFFFFLEDLLAFLIFFAIRRRCSGLAVARQPELQPMLLTQLFIVLALVDAVPIIGVGISLYMIFAL